MSEEQGRWVCASCGARHKSNDQPCRNCANEQFAKLEETTDEIERTESVTWVCDECGRESPSNSTQCRNCGSFSYSRQADPSSAADVSPAEAADEGRRRITLRWLAANGWGLFMALAAVGSLTVGAILSAPFYGVATVLSIPYTRRRIEDALNVAFSTAVIVVAEIILYLTAGYLALPYL